MDRLTVSSCEFFFGGGSCGLLARDCHVLPEINYAGGSAQIRSTADTKTPA